MYILVKEIRDNYCGHFWELFLVIWMLSSPGRFRTGECVTWRRNTALPITGFQKGCISKNKKWGGARGCKLRFEQSWRIKYIWSQQEKGKVFKRTDSEESGEDVEILWPRNHFHRSLHFPQRVLLRAPYPHEMETSQFLRDSIVQRRESVAPAACRSWEGQQPLWAPSFFLPPCNTAHPLEMGKFFFLAKRAHHIACEHGKNTT